MIGHFPKSLSAAEECNEKKTFHKLIQKAGLDLQCSNK